MGGMVRMGGIAAAPPPERVADRGDRTFAKGERQPHTLTPSNQPCNPPPSPPQASRTDYQAHGPPKRRLVVIPPLPLPLS